MKIPPSLYTLPVKYPEAFSKRYRVQVFPEEGADIKPTLDSFPTPFFNLVQKKNLAFLLH